MTSQNRDFTRDELHELLRQVGELLHAEGTAASIYVVGGAAMALEFQSRRVTADVDSAIRSGGQHFWDAVSEVAERHGLDPEWVNTNAAAFMPNETDEAASELNLPGLRIAVSSPEHLIAMKLRSLRERDMDDLEVLFRLVGVTEAQQAADIHDRLFDNTTMGYVSEEESLYAARQVFMRAEARGRPIGSDAAPVPDFDLEPAPGPGAPAMLCGATNVDGTRCGNVRGSCPHHNR